MATAVALVASVASLLAAIIALVYARRTVLDGRAAQAEQAHERELARLYQLAELVGQVPLAAQDEEWTQHFAVSQGRLRMALAGRERLAHCLDLATGGPENVFETYLDASEEVKEEIGRHLAAAITTSGVADATT